MKKRIIFVLMSKISLLALVLCMILAMTGCSAKENVKFDLGELAGGKVYGAIQPGSTYENIEAAGIPLIAEPISEMNWADRGKKSYTYAANMEKIAVSVNGTTMESVSFQILGDELINVAFTPRKNTPSEATEKAFKEKFGAPEERPSSRSGIVTLVWLIEAEGHTIQLGLIKNTDGGKEYCSSIQISFLDLVMPPAG